MIIKMMRHKITWNVEESTYFKNNYIAIELENW